MVEISNFGTLVLAIKLYDKNNVKRDVVLGFPGNLRQSIRYILTEENEFQIEYDMVADQTTVVNPTNHSYFNLNGHDSGSILGHEMEIWSDTFLETDKQLIPTGKYINVKGTPMDFQTYVECKFIRETF